MISASVVALRPPTDGAESVAEGRSCKAFQGHRHSVCDFNHPDIKQRPLKGPPWKPRTGQSVQTHIVLISFDRKKQSTLQMWSLKEPLSLNGLMSNADDSLMLKNNSGHRYGTWRGATTIRLQLLFNNMQLPLDWTRLTHLNKHVPSLYLPYIIPVQPLQVYRLTHTHTHT